jgi:thioesterase domain-containing protein
MIGKEKLEAYLHQNIPLSQAIGIQVVSLSHREVTLSAPFSNNINHKKTVFGGSLHAVATLTCWSLIHVNLEELHPLDIVITTSTIHYLLPVTSDFEAQCQIPEESVWQRFIAMTRSKGKGRISLKAAIYQDGKLAVDYEGTFAAIKKIGSLQI